MKLLAYYKTDGLFWFRIFGYGAVIKNIRKHQLLFSERMGYKKFLKIGNWVVTFLN
jgi:hypothetical protein